MERKVTHDDLMRYLDGEITPEERAWVDECLEDSTELQRELAVFRAMKNDLQDLTFVAPTGGDSIWSAVNRRITRPLGWLLVIVGTAVWSVYGAYLFATSAVNPVEKLTVGAILIGLALLLGSVVWERYGEWQTDPYRDVHR